MALKEERGGDATLQYYLRQQHHSFHVTPTRYGSSLVQSCPYVIYIYIYIIPLILHSVSNICILEVDIYIMYTYFPPNPESAWFLGSRPSFFSPMTAIFFPGPNAMCNFSRLSSHYCQGGVYFSPQPSCPLRRIRNVAEGEGIISSPPNHSLIVHVYPYMHSLRYAIDKLRARRSYEASLSTSYLSIYLPSRTQVAVVWPPISMCIKLCLSRH